MRLAFILGLTCILLHSCIDLQKNDRLEQIHALQKTVDSVSTGFNANRLDSIVPIRVKINNLELRIKQFYKGDTISKELGAKMDAFRKIKMNFNPENEVGEEGEEEHEEESIIKFHSFIKKGISEEKKALSALYSDIESGSGERDKYDEYIKFEREKVRQIKVLATEYVKRKNKLLTSFDTIYTDLYNFSLKLEQDNTK